MADLNRPTLLVSWSIDPTTDPEKMLPVYSQC